MAQVGLQPVCHTLGSCHVVLLAHSFKRKHLLNPLLRPRNRATYKKGNTHLIKSQSPITRESEKEMKWLICAEAHSLLAALYALFHLVLTALLLRGRYYCILWVMKLKLRKSNNLCKSQNWYKKKNRATIQNLVQLTNLCSSVTLNHYSSILDPTHPG